MSSLLFLSFFAGILTVLAPCVLPLLPVIIGSSLDGNNRWKPYLVTLGLVISITVFTILLKASTLLINIDPIVWKYISGGLVLVFGLIYLFPNLWNKISLALNLSSKSDHVLENATQKEGFLGALLTGAALGPVFASCSPTYSLIIATVLPVNFYEGLGYIIIYALGLASVMLAVALLGRKLVAKLRVFANPNGWFKRILGVIFLIVGISIMTGFDKVIETKILNSGYFDITQIDQNLLDKNMPAQTNNSTTFTSSKTNTVAKKPAPEIVGINQWINSNGETISGLKGKVVLVDFWTYSCINCQRTLPYVTKWYDTYKDKGLVVLGIHAPEFSFEQKLENVQKATKDFGINYPVGLDNEFKTWNNYSNQFWPAEYLIDKDGNIRHTHFGEGGYAETENIIRELLSENSTPVNTSTIAQSVSALKSSGQYCEGSKCIPQTPETYLGTDRRARLSTTDLQPNEWKIDTKWQSLPQEIVATEDGAVLELNFNAKSVYIVAQNDQQSELKISLNGTAIESMSVSDPKLYTLVNSDTFVVNGKLTITAQKGTRLNAFTFG
jgi:cytochrome c biogenesis protein CcdA/thiol-disulfide isomerase/thioredoxin